MARRIRPGSVLLAACVVVVGLVVSSHVARADAGFGQVIMKNDTTIPADFFVDGALQDRAQVGGSVTAQVPVGSHNLKVVCTDGSTLERSVDVAEDDTLTWTITERFVSQ
jgi:hypothetical protein